MLLVVGRFQVGVESIETLLPEVAVLGHPAGGLRHGAGVESAVMDAAFLAAGEQPGVL